jgi:RNA polymerase primary sigma factor
LRQLKITQNITLRDDKSIGRYFQDVNKYPMITADEEVELSIRISHGDDVALQQLVQANLRFVISVAKQYQHKGLPFSDLINEGNFGLVKAARRFDQTRGFKFISYAVWWIRQSIMQAISEQTRTVRLPLNRLSSIKKVNRAIIHLEQEFEREPTDIEIAEHLQLTNEEVRIANKNKYLQVSFDKPLSADDDNAFNLYDLIQTGSIPHPDSDVMKESMTININRALRKLSSREAKVIRSYFGLVGFPPMTVNDIAAEFKMSTERINQIKHAGLVKLKKLLKDSEAFLDY